MEARLDWDDLAVFLATAQGGTLAAAGESLGINASTVHRKLADLEAQLNARLFDRSQRGYALTASGEELLEHVQAMESEVLALRRKISGRDARLEGIVRVATVDDLAIRFVTGVIRDFRALHPGVSVELSIQAEFADLTRRQADVAIRFGLEPREPDLVVRHIARVEVALYGGTSYLRRHGVPRRPEDLRAHSVLRGDRRLAKLPVEKFMDRYADPAKVALRSNSMLARLAAVRDGVGIGFLGYFMAERERTLTRLPFVFPNAGTDLWMVVHVDLRRSARVRAFVDFAYDALVAQRECFAAPKAAGKSRVQTIEL